jgi:hypothetical protein
MSQRPTFKCEEQPSSKGPRLAPLHGSVPDGPPGGVEHVEQVIHDVGHPRERQDLTIRRPLGRERAPFEQFHDEDRAVVVGRRERARQPSLEKGLT